MHRDLDRLERWVWANLRNSNKVKGRVLHEHQENPNTNTGWAENAAEWLLESLSNPNHSMIMITAVPKKIGSRTCESVLQHMGK